METISAIVTTSSRPRSETTLAVLTIAAAMLHFLGEGYYHLRWGQPILSLLADVFAILLLTIAATMSLIQRPSSAAGLLAAAWGFTSCLAYRAVSERLDGGEAAEGGRELLLIILIVAAAIAGLLFLWALALAWPSPRFPSVSERATRD